MIIFAPKMGKDHFQFRQFIVRQDRCAMKVGTDGTLLGAWAETAVPDGRILDIGTGLGLIALMMAQRFSVSQVTAVEIDAIACQQASENVAASPFASRIRCIPTDIADFADAAGFDAIVSNPPYFVQSLTCPDGQRTLARHTASLSYDVLMKSAYRLLRDDGLFSVIIPADSYPQIDAAARLQCFFPSRLCAVKTTPAKNPRRYLIEYRKHAVEEVDTTIGVIEDAPCVRSDWYTRLTKDFYL